jgi:hypothetical protein
VDPEKVSALQEEAARSLFDRIDGTLNRWEAAEFRFALIGGYASRALSVDSGAANEVRTPVEIGSILRDLRSAMASPSGPWFTCILSVTSKGEFNYKFEYDAEPNWDGPKPSIGEYERDLQEFPRSREDIPTWFPDDISERA